MWKVLGKWQMETMRARIAAGGRIVIPAEYRRALGIHEGDEVILRLQDGEVRILSPHEAIKRAQDLVAQYVSADRFLADELIAERRRDAERE